MRRGGGIDAIAVERDVELDAGRVEADIGGGRVGKLGGEIGPVDGGRAGIDQVGAAEEDALIGGDVDRSRSAVGRDGMRRAIGQVAVQDVPEVAGDGAQHAGAMAAQDGERHAGFIDQNSQRPDRPRPAGIGVGRNVAPLSTDMKMRPSAVPA